MVQLNNILNFNLFDIKFACTEVKTNESREVAELGRKVGLLLNYLN